MDDMFVLFCLVIGFIVNWYTATCFDEIADAKGFRSSKYFWICFLLGPAGWFMVCALPDRGNVSTPNPTPAPASPSPSASVPYPALSDELPDL